MDERFHGSNPSEGAELTDQVPRIVSLMHSGHKAHGDFQLHYTDTVLNTGNGRVWGDWAVTGIRPGTLVALPYIAFFSQRHRLALKFGWLEISLLVGGKPLRRYRVRTWYEEAAAPVSDSFFFEAHRVRTWCSAIPGEARLVFDLRIYPYRRIDEDVVVVLRGASTLGEEAGSPYDAVNGTVGDREPLPVRLRMEPKRQSLLISNPDASVHARLLCSRPIRCEVSHGHVTVAGPNRSDVKDQALFEIRCPLAAAPAKADAKDADSAAGEFDFAFELLLDDAPPPAAAARRWSLPEIGRAWRNEWSCLEPLATPDPQLTTALKRSAVYSESLLPIVDSTGTAAGMSDHVEWPMDCARDGCHIAEALLFLKPDMVRRHLAFYFLEAIPRAGVGKSYVPTGETRGHSDARLLDLAAYPLWHLWRYWKATGDGEFAALPRVRETVARITDEVLGWRDERTGLLTSTERSSDEVCVFPVFVPGNAMFVGAVERMAELCRVVWHDPDAARRHTEAASQLRGSLWRHAVIDDPEFGRMFAFEVGRLDEFLLYDQADIPNLLSLPRFGFCPSGDPVYQNTLRFAFSRRNQGFRGTADGKYRHLCDGSKTQPASPWPLGPLGQLLSTEPTPAEAARLFDWLRDALTPAFQLPEISDKHTARPVQRYWFGWPTAALLTAFIEVVCGVKLGEAVSICPMLPEGWTDFASPRLTVRGREVMVAARQGRMSILVDGRESATQAQAAIIYDANAKDTQ